MSTPAGWHKQDDGRERFWDGQRWTDQFRDPTFTASSEPKKPSNMKHWIGYGAAGLVGLLVGAGMGAAAAGDGGTPAATGSTITKTESATVTTTATPPAATTITKTATVKVTPTPTAAISEGVWEVGVDIKPGKYKVIQAIEEECYWEIDKTGTDDIVDNDNVTGGRPVVVLRKGQTFTNHGCGDWARVG